MHPACGRRCLAEKLQVNKAARAPPGGLLVRRWYAQLHSEQLFQSGFGVIPCADC